MQEPGFETGEWRRAASDRRGQYGLLAALPDAELAHWRLHLEAFELRIGKVFYESGIGLSEVYFPTTAIVSLLSVMGDGSSAEIAVGGDDGGSDDLLTVLVAPRTLIQAVDQLAPVRLARLQASIVLFKARDGVCSGGFAAARCGKTRKAET